jgi:hypothetical protein
MRYSVCGARDGGTHQLHGGLPLLRLELSRSPTGKRPQRPEGEDAMPRANVHQPNFKFDLVFERIIDVRQFPKFRALDGGE